MRRLIIFVSFGHDRCEISDSVRGVSLLCQLLYDVSESPLNFATSRRQFNRLLGLNSNSGIYLRIGLCNRALLIFFNKSDPLP